VGTIFFSEQPDLTLYDSVSLRFIGARYMPGKNLGNGITWRAGNIEETCGNRQAK
jgi:hypothetical protein